MTALRQTGLLLRWQLRRNAASLPVFILVQVLLAVTTVLGYRLLIGDVESDIGQFLATGAPTVTLVMVGLVMTPQLVSQSKVEGTFDWMRTLPVPRFAYLAADLLLWTMIALPATVLGIIFGAWQFQVALAPSPFIVPAALFVSLTAAAIGYAVALMLQPMLAQLVSQTLVFIVLLFSPVSYPAARMPEWLQAVHQWLPIEPMADLMRAMLNDDIFAVSARSLLVLAVWCVSAVGIANHALRRRA